MLRDIDFFFGVIKKMPPKIIYAATTSLAARENEVLKCHRQVPHLSRRFPEFRSFRSVGTISCQNMPITRA